MYIIKHEPYQNYNNIPENKIVALALIMSKTVEKCVAAIVTFFELLISV
jgi:hypothetical protein